MRVPSSTPAGMLTFSVLSRRTRPWPAQLRHGLSITWPAPWQVWQVRSTVKKPCWARSRPRPWQVGHCCGLEPASAPLPWQTSQATELGTRTVASVPP